MSIKKQFNQELFFSTIQSIQELAKELNIGLFVNRCRLHEAPGTGLTKLTPSIFVTVGGVALKVWSISLTRNVTMLAFKEISGEMLYAEAYGNLLEFMLRNNMRTLLSAKFHEASVTNEDMEVSTPVFKHTSKERKAEIAFRLDQEQVEV